MNRRRTDAEADEAADIPSLTAQAEDHLAKTRSAWLADQARAQQGSSPLSGALKDTCVSCPTMTPDQFAFWVRGMAEAADDNRLTLHTLRRIFEAARKMR